MLMYLSRCLKGKFAKHSGIFVFSLKGNLCSYIFFVNNIRKRISGKLNKRSFHLLQTFPANNQSKIVFNHTTTW